MDDIYDQELDDVREETTHQEASESKGEAKEEVKPLEQSQKDEGIKLSKEEYDSFRAMQQRESLKSLESDIRKRHADFDMQKTIDKMMEIDKQNPGFADEYFTPIGLENIYLNHFKGKVAVSEDEFDIPRGSGGAVNLDELVSKINSGEASEEDSLALYARLCK